jgi:transposase
LLLKNEEDLDDDNKKRLAELLALNTPLSIAYILKEDLRQIWEQKNKRMAKTALENWVLRAGSSGNEHLNKLANTIENHAEGILNWYDFPINSG